MKKENIRLKEPAIASFKEWSKRNFLSQRRKVPMDVDLFKGSEAPGAIALKIRQKIAHRVSDED